MARGITAIWRRHAALPRICFAQPVAFLVLTTEGKLMQTEATAVSTATATQGSGRIFGLLFGLILLAGAGHASLHLVDDLSIVRSHSPTPCILLILLAGVLFIALKDWF
ncbi:hypothetical protein [Dyella sp.]|uniref:hypothetical protein n=1 Tax=Dyella sp. TaxID=1869338 RepID=UPI002FDA8EE9